LLFFVTYTINHHAFCAYFTAFGYKDKKAVLSQGKCAMPQLYSQALKAGFRALNIGAKQNLTQNGH